MRGGWRWRGAPKQSQIGATYSGHQISRQFHAQFNSDSLEIRDMGQAMYLLQENVRIMKEFEELVWNLELSVLAVRRAGVINLQRLDAPP
jgi:hypothetical protein